MRKHLDVCMHLQKGELEGTRVCTVCEPTCQQECLEGARRRAEASRGGRGLAQVERRRAEASRGGRRWFGGEWRRAEASRDQRRWAQVGAGGEEASRGRRRWAQVERRQAAAGRGLGPPSPARVLDTEQISLLIAPLGSFFMPPRRASNLHQLPCFRPYTAGPPSTYPQPQPA